MTARRTHSSSDPAAWYALREYLVDAYSNSEMRALVERSLIAEAGTRLPDERVSAQEYAATLCGLIQRHTGAPSSDFWRMLAADRPLRQREIRQIQVTFPGSPVDAGDVSARATNHGLDLGWRWSAGKACAVVLVAAGVAAATYCASLPPPPRPKLLCRDGTVSPTCDEIRPGCCSRHGGVADSQVPAPH